MPAEMTSLPQIRSGHDIEAEVRRELLAVKGVSIASLVVRRIPNGVCLQGILLREDDSMDLCEIIRRIPGIAEVQNHTVQCIDAAAADCVVSGAE